MATSTYPVFKAALVAALSSTQVQSVLQPPVQVGYGEQVMPETDCVWVMSVQDGKQASRYQGSQNRTETYTQPVLIQTVQSDVASGQLATERAFALMAAVEEQLRGGSSGVGGDPSVSGSVRWAIVSSWRYSEGVLANGSQRMCHLMVNLGVEAVI